MNKFVSIPAICRSGCHQTRGYCESPGECRCRLGWSGSTCHGCQILPGCMHGDCSKPLECRCQPGYRGLLCQSGKTFWNSCQTVFLNIKVYFVAMCNSTCHPQHGYCEKPGECRCRTGWMGEDCDKCHAYPGCKHGTCRRPWECNCEPGWGGFLCDEQLDYCEKNPKTCQNGGKCTSVVKEDGDFTCECPSGYRGKNCEKAPAMAMKVKTTSKTTTTTTTTEEPEVNQDNVEVEDEMAMAEPENSPKTRGEAIPGESLELEDIDNEAL